MSRWRFGLRIKLTLALAVAGIVVLVPTGLIGYRALDDARDYFGEGYARNYTLLYRQKILAPVARELLLSQRLADSVAIRRWLGNEEDSQLRALAFEEAGSYLKAFQEHNYFVISASSRDYYYNGEDRPFSEEPRYRLSRGDSTDDWFFRTMANTSDFNINVDPDPKLGVTKLWFNVLVKGGGRRLGLAGTSLDLSDFIQALMADREAGVTPMIVDESGAIQAHPDATLIAYDSGSGGHAGARTLGSFLVGEGDAAALAAALAAAMKKPGEVALFRATLEGKQQLVAVSWLPELRWYVAAAVDLQVAQVIRKGWPAYALGAVAVLVLLILAAFGLAVDRLIIAPLRGLHRSAQALSGGNYDVRPPTSGADELGDLGRAFAGMAGRIRRHTDELEEKVRVRTQALEEANRDMAVAHKKIGDSIKYASIIQQALLPDVQMARVLGDHHFVLWHPRDVVGGDFYVFETRGESCLLGVVDCAGHGVPGALMTMLARAALDQAISRSGIDSPAAILQQAEVTLGGMLKQAELPRSVATDMDVGLAMVDRAAGKLRYAGASLSLYWSNGREVGEAKGRRRAIGHRRGGQFVDMEMDLQRDTTYYLTTDGFLDQGGGAQGYGFGHGRFAELLLRHARSPLAEQARAFGEALAAYRGRHPQRDDITLLSFRFD